MKPGKKDYDTKNAKDEKIHVQKRYLQWPMRDILDMLNGSVLVSPSKLCLKKNYRSRSFTNLSKKANSTF